MATTTPRLGLRKPETTDFVDVQLDIAENMQKLDDQFDPAGAGAHTHDGANSKQISHNDLLDMTTGDPHTQYMLKSAAGVVTDENIGNRTVDPTQTPVGNTGKLGQLFNWLVNRIKAITGGANWYDAPATTLAAAKAHMDNKSNPHSVTAAQVGAPVSVEGVSNPGGNIDLVGSGITVTADNGAAKKITLTATATSIGALVSVDGVSNPGGNVDLVAGGAISITPNTSAKTVTVTETHSSRTDNPHGVTAAQVGAPVSVDGVSNAGGNIDLVAGTNIAITPNNTTKTITVAVTGTVANATNATTAANSDKVDNIHFRISNGSLEYSTDNATWTQAGLSQGKLMALIMALQ